MIDHYKPIITKLNKDLKSLELYHGLTVYKFAKEGFIYLRYSGGSKTGDKFFFGIEENTIKILTDFDFSMIFVCGKEDIKFVINKDIILRLLKNVKISSGQWKVNILFKDDEWFLKVSGKDKFRVTEYLNRLDLILSKSFFVENIPAAKTIELNQDNENKENSNQLNIIIKNLKLSSILSNEPDLFEKEVLNAFNFLGFNGKHIGGSGNTDVVIESPYRMILETKTTRKVSIAKIYFTRLKQHQIKNNAEYIIILANKFSPSVVRDAEIEMAILLNTETLCKILKIHEKFPLVPTDLEFIFKKPGLVQEKDLVEFFSRHQRLLVLTKNFQIILKAVNNKKKPIDEIYGRYQMLCEKSSFDSLDKKDFNNMLNFLAIPSFSLVIRVNNEYYLNIDNKIASERLAKIGELLNESFK